MKEKFLKCIKEILDDKNVEGVKIENLENINEIFNNKEVVDILYNDFLVNYINEYGNDESYLFLKIGDMIHAINLLVKNIIIDKFNITDKFDINNAFENYLTKNNDGSIFMSYCYDDNDLIAVEENFGYLKYDDLIEKLKDDKDDRFKEVK